MKDYLDFSTLAKAFIIALVMSLSVTINAVADDATPPPVQTEESAPPTDVPAVVQQSGEATEAPLLMPTEAPVEETRAGDPVLEQIPENTTIIVTTDAEVEPLATQKAANSFVIGDPIWCPEGATPDPGFNGCTGSYATLSELIEKIENLDIPQPNDHGVIWILAGNDLSSSAIGIDGSIFSSWGNYRLTIQGGWDGPGLGTTTGGSVFNKPIEITNWNNNVTINDVILNGTNSTGLYVQTSGDVTVNNVFSNGNLGSGAELSSSSGNVILTGTNQFNDNNDTGLYVNAAGVVDAQNVTASNNGAGGSYGYGAEFVAAGLNLSGTNVFNGNNESGLFVDINGDISIANITANGNGTGNAYGAGAELISSGSVVISGSNNVFNGNLSEGLVVDAQGSISISGTQIQNNQDTGAYLISNGNIVLDCSRIAGNDGYGVDANSSNLVFTGVELDQNTDGNVINSGSISFKSNSCFTYPSGKGGGGGNIIPSEPILPVNMLTVSSGQTAELDCELFSGTVVSLLSGHGAFLPCSLGATARLIDMERDAIPDFLPRGYRFVSSFNLTVMQENQPLAPLGESESVWFWNAGSNDGGQEFSHVLYWDGENWVESGDQTISFMRLFFLIPESARGSNLAVLYWDGSSWVELKDNLNLGSGRFVQRGGHSSGMYFEASVNFIGTFVLAQK